MTAMTTKILYLAMLIFGAFAAYADTSSVVNSVSVSASTGGNTVSPGSSGTVVNGGGSASYSVETTVNGETVQNVNESYSGPASVDKTYDYSEGSTSVSTTVHAAVGGGGNGEAVMNGRGAAGVVPPRAGGVTVKTAAGVGHDFGENVNGEAVSASSSASTTVHAREVGFGTLLRSYLSNLFDHVFSFFSL